MDGERTCLICSREICSPDSAAHILPCSHAQWHESCIHQWLTRLDERTTTRCSNCDSLGLRKKALRFAWFCLRQFSIFRPLSEEYILCVFFRFLKQPQLFHASEKSRMGSSQQRLAASRREAGGSRTNIHWSLFEWKTGHCLFGWNT